MSQRFSSVVNSTSFTPINSGQSLLSNFTKTQETASEFILQLKTKTGQVIEFKTEKFSEKEALREIPFAIYHCNTNYGKVTSWKWKGDNVVHTNTTNIFKRTLGEKIFDLLGLESKRNY